jgi:hypothetical protein
MADGNILGLLFEISADPSRAEQALADFEARTGKSFETVTGASKPFNEALLTSRESTRLLSEELGLHLPRAVTSAISEVMPAISALGPALLGAFAIAELPKLIGGIKEATEWIGGFGKEARKAFAEAVKASDEAYTHFKDIKTGISLREEVNRNIAALTVQRDLLDSTGGSAMNYAKAVGALLSGNAVLAGVYTGLARAQQVATADLAKLEQTRFEQLQRETELEKVAVREHASAMREIAAQEHAEARAAMERIHIIQAAGKELKEMDKQQKEAAKGAQELAKDQLNFALNLERYGVVAQRDYTEQLKATTPVVKEQTEHVKHLSAAHKELIGMKQTLRHVSEMLRKALEDEGQAMLAATSRMGGIGEQIAQLVGGKRAEADVRGGFDAAMSIEEMAVFLASWGTDTAALAASVEYGLAAAEMFKVAGRGGGSRASAAGTAVGGGGYGAGPGGGGRVGGGGGRGGGGGGSYLLPGVGPSSELAGTTVVLQAFGDCQTCLSKFANYLSQGVQNGTIKSIAMSTPVVNKGAQ